MRISNVVHAVDAHACGEHGRVIVGGVLDVPGTTMFDKMCYLRDHADGLRKRMLREPRGYPAANCNLILPSSNPEADAGYVIMEQVEYPGMSGTNTICVTTVLLETGMLPMTEPITELTLESPAGLIRVRADCANGKVKRVTFRNVPAFAAYLDTRIEVPHLGTVTVDVAYGGMFYVIADATQFGLRLTPDEGRDITRIGELVKAAAQGNPPAAYTLGEIHSGLFSSLRARMRRDPAKACMWYAITERLIGSSSWNQQFPDVAAALRNDLEEKVAKTDGKLKPEEKNSCQADTNQWLAAHPLPPQAK